MEQRIGSNTKPLTPPAAVDPALIPGLTAPATADGAPEDAAVPGAASDEADAVVEDAAPEPEDAAEADAVGSADDSGEAADSGEDLGEGVSASAPVPDGPVFEAKDFRARLVADHAGIRLCLDDQECEFRWDEIGAVETSTSGFGKRYTVVVHTPDRRWYWIEIDAKSRADIARWETELDAVLDAYFEEADAQPADAETDADVDVDAGVDAEATADTEADEEADAKADAKAEGARGRKPGPAQA
ncbi:hypothetical protein ABT026_23295 [Streptomyces sp. NPDC002734]|uniref:hypothetical protein n=1 Tax=Streptomyces sp. NPDC002734 TaxID=3154426 RepID=UPI0033231AEA